MKTLGWVLTVYLGTVGVATLLQNVTTNAGGTSTLAGIEDTVAALPSIGSLFGSVGVTAGGLDLAGAAAAYYFLVHRR